MTAPILALDPGQHRTAWLLLVDGMPRTFGEADNEALLRALRDESAMPDPRRGNGEWRMFDDQGTGVFRWAADRTVVMEAVEPHRMPLGPEVADTLRWEGRFGEAVESGGIPFHTLYRREVAKHLAFHGAGDSFIRAALMTRFGGEGAKGTKHSPGSLYGIGGTHLFAALGVAVTWADLHREDGR